MCVCVSSSKADRDRKREVMTTKIMTVVVVVVVLLVACWPMHSAASESASVKRDAHCSEGDWSCVTREMLAVIDEEFAAVGNRTGTNIRQEYLTSIKYYAEYTNDPAWLRCSKIDFGSFVGLDNKVLQDEIANLSLLKLCDPKTGTKKEDATCLAFWAASMSQLHINQYTYICAYANRVTASMLTETDTQECYSSVHL